MSGLEAAIGMLVEDDDSREGGVGSAGEGARGGEDDGDGDIAAILGTLNELQSPPYVTDLRTLLMRATEGEESTLDVDMLIMHWTKMKFGYIYFSHPKIQNPTEFLQAIYQETIAIIGTPKRACTDSNRWGRISSLAMILLLLLFECQPHRHRRLEVKIRVTMSNWAVMSRYHGAQYLFDQGAFLLVASPSITIAPATAPQNLDVRTKRPLARIHVPPFYGYNLDLGTSGELLAERERHNKAMKLETEATELMELDDYKHIDHALRTYRKAKAKLKTHQVYLPERGMATFAVDARQRFEKFAQKKKSE